MTHDNLAFSLAASWFEGEATFSLLLNNFQFLFHTFTSSLPTLPFLKHRQLKKKSILFEAKPKTSEHECFIQYRLILKQTIHGILTCVDFSTMILSSNVVLFAGIFIKHNPDQPLIKTIAYYTIIRSLKFTQKYRLYRPIKHVYT